MTNRMKNKVREEGIELPAGADLFDLLAVACSQCCTDFEGGNKTCPPPPKLN